MMVGDSPDDWTIDECLDAVTPSVALIRACAAVSCGRPADPDWTNGRPRWHPS